MRSSVWCLLVLVAAVHCQDVLERGANDNGFPSFQKPDADPNDPTHEQDHGVQIVVNYARATHDTLGALYDRMDRLEKMVQELRARQENMGQYM